MKKIYSLILLASAISFSSLYASEVDLLKKYKDSITLVLAADNKSFTKKVGRKLGTDLPEGFSNLLESALACKTHEDVWKFIVAYKKSAFAKNTIKFLKKDPIIRGSAGTFFPPAASALAGLSRRTPVFRRAIMPCPKEDVALWIQATLERQEVEAVAE